MSLSSASKCLQASEQNQSRGQNDLRLGASWLLFNAFSLISDDRIKNDSECLSHHSIKHESDHEEQSGL